MSTDYLNPNTWRLSTAGGIKYRIISLDGEVFQNHATFSETILIPATSLRAFIVESFPPPVVQNNVPIYNNRAYPAFRSMRTTKLNFRSHVDGKPIDPFLTDPAADVGTYHPVVEVQIEYANEVEKDGTKPETYLEINANASGEFIHVSGPKANWETAGNQNKEPVIPAPVLVPQTEWSIKWKQVPRDFWRDYLVHQLRKAMGKVNSKPMSLMFNTPAETILFAGYTLREDFLNPSTALEDDEKEDRNERDNENQPVTITFKFVEKFLEDDTAVITRYENERKDENGVLITESVGYRGHNDFWKPDAGWKRLLYDGTNPIHEEFDHNTLFSEATEERNPNA